MEKFSSAFTWAIGLLETKRTALNSIVCLLKQASLLQEKRRGQQAAPLCRVLPLGCGDHRLDLIRVAALRSARVDGGGHVEVRLSRLDRGVGVGHGHIQ